MDQLKAVQEALKKLPDKKSILFVGSLNRETIDFLYENNCYFEAVIANISGIEKNAMAIFKGEEVPENFDFAYTIYAES